MDFTISKDILTSFIKPFIILSGGDEIRLDIKPDGITIEKVSLDHVALGSATLTIDTGSDPFSVTVPVKKLTEALAVCSGEITVYIDLYTVAIECGQLKRTIRTGEASDDTIRIPVIDGEEVDLSGCAGWIKDIAIEDTVKFVWTRANLQLISGDETTSASYTIPISVENEGTAIFPSEYLVSLLHSIDKGAKVTAKIWTEYPIEIDYTDPKGIVGKIFIAPRIDKGDE